MEILLLIIALPIIFTFVVQVGICLGIFGAATVVTVLNKKDQ